MRKQKISLKKSKKKKKPQEAFKHRTESDPVPHKAALAYGKHTNIWSW